jgi:hypothetical protein
MYEIEILHERWCPNGQKKKEDYLKPSWYNCPKIKRKGVSENLPVDFEA